jgi:hypothetical protein
MKHYFAAIHLERPPKWALHDHVALVEAAYPSENSTEFANWVKVLAERPDFDLLDRPTVIRLGRVFAQWADDQWADGNSTSAVELLDPLAPIFQKIESEDNLGEPADYWLGRYLMRTKDKNDKDAALKRFAKALVASKSPSANHDRDRFQMVEKVLGEIKDSDKPKDWLKVFSIAVPNVPAGRSKRQWELLVHKCRLLAENGRLKTDLIKDMVSGDSKLLKSVGEIIEYSTDAKRTDLRIEARVAGWWGVNAFRATPELNTATKEVQLASWNKLKEFSRELTADLSDEKAFREWPNRKTVGTVNKIAEALETASEALKSINRTDDAGDFAGYASKIKAAVKAYEKWLETHSTDGVRSLSKSSPINVAALTP